MKRKDVEKLLKKEVNAFDDHDSLAEIKSRLGMEDTHAHVQRDGSVAVTRRRNRFVVIIAAFAAAVAARQYDPVGTVVPRVFRQKRSLCARGHFHGRTADRNERGDGKRGARVLAFGRGLRAGGVRRARCGTGRIYAARRHADQCRGVKNRV